MERLLRLPVPGYEGRAVPVNAGAGIRITNVEGTQIGDLFAIVREDPREFLCTARTRLTAQRLFPAVGQVFCTNRYRPILTFLRDTSLGVHDCLYASCDPGLYELLCAQPGHANCHENFLRAVRTVGLEFDFVPGPVNLWQNTPVHADGTLTAGRSPARAGDFVELRAELDIYLVLTSCSVDVGVAADINGGTSTPLLIEVFAQQDG